MSYDISFWRESRPVGLSPNGVYRRLSRGKPVEGLAELPVEVVFAGLREAFADRRRLHVNINAPGSQIIFASGAAR